MTIAPPDTEVANHIRALTPERKRAEAEHLDALFREVSGFAPRLFRGRMVGYGTYHYHYASGHSGRSLATGFAAGAAKFSIYIMPGYADFSEILSDLGKHRMGKSCLYINKLDDVDLGVLRRLVSAGLEDLARQWPITPT